MKLSSVNRSLLLDRLFESGINFSDLLIYESTEQEVLTFKTPSPELTLATQIVGWTYFSAWVVAFYPQILSNFCRKSVVGLHLDFIALNFTGYLTYSVFNAGLLWIPELQEEYLSLHPGGVIPVQLNDALFSIHGTLAVVVWIIQAFVFEREGQEVSLVCISLLLLISSYVLVCLTITVVGGMSWLSFIYYFSYIKLVTSITKYTPQVVLHYKRKTTEGFNMIGVLCDLTGGAFSIAQMFLIAINYDDWGSITGDPAKLGLGLISVTYCIIFIVQRYMLGNEYQPIQ